MEVCLSNTQTFNEIINLNWTQPENSNHDQRTPWYLKENKPWPNLRTGQVMIYITNVQFVYPKLFRNHSTSRYDCYYFTQNEN